MSLTETPSKKREGLSPEMLLAIRDEVEDRLKNPPASFDGQIKQGVEKHLEIHIQKYKLHFKWMIAAAVLIVGWFGYQWNVTVPKQITEALERRNIGDVITNVVDNKVDEIAVPQIRKEIINTIKPQLSKLSSDTTNLTSELLKLSSTNDDNSRLLQVMNQDKTSFSNLYLKANNTNSPDFYLEQMLGTIEERASYDASFLLQYQIHIPNLVENPTMLDFSNLYYNTFSVNPFVKSGLLKQCWLATNISISECDKAGFLIRSMGYDNNIVVANTAATILNQARNVGQSFLNVGAFDNWFQNNTNYFQNHDDYAQWVKTNQFIKNNICFSKHGFLSDV
jgi:hypothetical protein